MGCVQSRGDGAKRLTREKVEKLLRKSKGQYHDLAEELKEMIRRREETVKELKSAADKLDEQHRKAKTIKKVGTGLGTASAVVGGVGIILIPFTGGFSAVLTVGAAVGGFGGAAGGVAISLFTKQYMEVLDQKYLEKVDKIIERDKEQCERVEKLWKEFDGVCTDIIRDIQFSREQVGKKKEEDTFDNILQKATEMKSAPSALGSDKSIGPLVAVAVLGKLNFEEFIKSLAEGHNGIPSEVAVDIRNKASDLERQCNRWRDLLPQPSE